MQGLMMQGALTLRAILDRAERIHGRREVVSRAGDRGITRAGYAEVAARARRLAAGLADLGVPAGARVATLMWNTREHLEVYFGVPGRGAVVHTINPRLSEREIGHIVNHAEDEAIVADASLLDRLEMVLRARPVRHVIVLGDAGGAMRDGWVAYEDLLDRPDPGEPVDPQVDELAACILCYTSGTTGSPKGVLYSHRSTVLHAMTLTMADVFAVGERDTVLPVVPMFHVNAWGFPFACAMSGAGQVMPNRWLDPASLLELLEGEGVTLSAGVPTVWMPLLAALDAEPGRHDLSRVRGLVVGGSAAPRAMIEGFLDRHGLTVIHAWGLTETSPVASVSTVPWDLRDAAADDQIGARVRQGRPLPLVDIRARHEGEGLIPWDGVAMGELEVRGPWVAAGYLGGDGADRWTDDGWFRTGDIVTIDGRGSIEICDRSKDLIKSGGEWISSVALENALMAHPAVAEAAVIAIPDERWAERPLAAVVPRAGTAVTGEELRDHLAAEFPRWWLPDRYEFVDAIPRTATGKWKKSVLREMFAG